MENRCDYHAFDDASEFAKNYLLDHNSFMLFEFAHYLYGIAKFEYKKDSFKKFHSHG